MSGISGGNTTRDRGCILTIRLNIYFNVCKYLIIDKKQGMLKTTDHSFYYIMNYDVSVCRPLSDELKMSHEGPSYIHRHEQVKSPSVRGCKHILWN